ncbi:diacylglycerol/lipid kinase family protein [Vaginisenegalia massiliensis]|uniref:diacylglycerol/lipid kinase family protein n=1 Tax=Vaginisenegalia massiliensis TaxID=2058294 RepID=UPI000F52C483|nr:diacylglycerol kinase family protein [Vaginisenegalia massiliensis]
MFERVLIIANPGSGKGLAETYANKLEELLREVYHSHTQVRLTEKAGDAKQWAQEASDEGYSTVICLGGDGTVNETAHGLMLASHSVEFGFIPMGTVNDLARAIGYDLHPLKAIEQFKTMSLEKMDIAQVNDQYFINVLAIGSVPESVMNTSSQDKNFWGPLAYVKDAMGAFFDGKGYDLIISTAEGTQVELKTSLLLVGLTNSVAGFETMIPQANYADGQVHLIAVKGNTPVDAVIAAGQLAIQVPSKPNLISLSSRAFSIENRQTNEKVVTNIDGDPGPSLPIKITVHPQAINVLVPQVSKDIS